MPVHSLRGRQPSANSFLSRFENVVHVVVLWQLQCAGIAWLGSSLSYEDIDLCAIDSFLSRFENVVVVLFPDQMQ